MRKLSLKFSQYHEVLLACSGGVDSMVLLDLFAKGYGKKKGRITVCNVNHNQRAGAKQDAKLVESTCRVLDLKYVACSLKIPKGASENTLRKARYEALKKIAGGLPIVTAHHADDQLETFLIRLLRGAHPETIRGMLSKSRVNGIEIWRPLLAFTKGDLIEYAKENKLKWREDPTNRKNLFTRNRIRNELIPLLKAIYPGADCRVLDFFLQITKDRRTDKKAETKSKAITKALLSTSGVQSKTAEFLHLKRALDGLLEDFSHHTTKAHWDALRRQLLKRQSTRSGGGEAKTLQFPGGHELRFRGNRLFWVKAY